MYTYNFVSIDLIDLIETIDLIVKQFSMIYLQSH